MCFAFSCRCVKFFDVFIGCGSCSALPCPLKRICSLVYYGSWQRMLYQVQSVDLLEDHLLIYREERLENGMWSPSGCDAARILGEWPMATAALLIQLVDHGWSLITRYHNRETLSCRSLRAAVSPLRTSRKQDPKQSSISEPSCSFLTHLTCFGCCNWCTCPIVGHVPSCVMSHVSWFSCFDAFRMWNEWHSRIVSASIGLPGPGVELYRWAAGCCSQLGSDYRCAVSTRHPTPRQPTQAVWITHTVSSKRIWTDILRI